MAEFSLVNARILKKALTCGVEISGFFTNKKKKNDFQESITYDYQLRATKSDLERGGEGLSNFQTKSTISPPFPIHTPLRRLYSIYTFYINMIFFFSNQNIPM